MFNLPNESRISCSRRDRPARRLHTLVRALASKLLPQVGEGEPDVFTSEVSEHHPLDVTRLLVARGPPAHNKLVGVRQLPDEPPAPVTRRSSCPESEVATKSLAQRDRPSASPGLPYIQQSALRNPSTSQIVERCGRVPPLEETAGTAAQEHRRLV